ncbi:MAG: hypothetical protein GY761_13770 [Hyphomicrobiales bacterium]|nr:hypothetical protein [Hyphomicrobiales bacterium]
MMKTVLFITFVMTKLLVTNVAYAGVEKQNAMNAMKELGIQVLQIQFGIVPSKNSNGSPDKELSVIMIGASKLPLLLEKRQIKSIELEYLRSICRDAVVSYIPGIKQSALNDDPKNFYIQLVAIKKGLIRNTNVDITYKFALKNGCSEKRVTLQKIQ